MKIKLLTVRSSLFLCFKLDASVQFKDCQNLSVLTGEKICDKLKKNLLSILTVIYIQSFRSDSQ